MKSIFKSKLTPTHFQTRWYLAGNGFGKSSDFSSTGKIIALSGSSGSSGIVVVGVSEIISGVVEIVIVSVILWLSSGMFSVTVVCSGSVLVSVSTVSPVSGTTSAVSEETSLLFRPSTHSPPFCSHLTICAAVYTAIKKRNQIYNPNICYSQFYTKIRNRWLTQLTTQQHNCNNK